MQSPELFHPLTSSWFTQTLTKATEPQDKGWPVIASGKDVLIAAPTGSGKTLAAFLVAIDRLVRQAVKGELQSGIQIIYISPLRALSNDVHKNLEIPLLGIEAQAQHEKLKALGIRTGVRTGDTPASKRAAIIRNPPHILVTTPESLYLMLTAAKGREVLKTAKTVIVDEIHALARDKRGSHLSLSLERLSDLCELRLQRIGLSATQRPISEVAHFLVGANEQGRSRPCEIIDIGYKRQMELLIDLPETPLSAVCSHDQWQEIYQSMANHINSHRATLIFVNTRRLAERVTHQLSEMLGEDVVKCHHGSLSKEQRFDAEDKLKKGELKAVVATASLELGIDVGYIDLVCQLGSPRSIATFLQRIGRSGHSLGLKPKGILLPLTRDELLEAIALLRGIKNGNLDILQLPNAPTDILMQQVVASVASKDWQEAELFRVMKAAWPFRNITKKSFSAILTLLSEGIVRHNKRGNYIHRDRIQETLKPRKSARMTAIMCGGAIPDLAEFRVVMQDGTFVGTLDEEFAIESSRGDVFLLGNTAWQIADVKIGQVIVNEAHAQAPSIPFWQGEAPGRSFELSEEVGGLREEIRKRLDLVALDSRAESGELIDRQDENKSCKAATEWMVSEIGVDYRAANTIAKYVLCQVAATGTVPTNDRIIFERFFDETGSMHLVIHAPFGQRITKAWGLAMRKRYCRRFDFELQATADDNGFVLAMGPQDGFALESMFKMINPTNARSLLEQAILQVPLFEVRWRWNAARSLAVQRMESGKRVPPHLQRYRANDLLAATFPQQTQCQEHISGDISIPDHPLVQQTMEDCLTEAMDFERWLGVITRMSTGDIELVAHDLREPSPFSYELINANPYAFLDEAPLEERRARALSTRRVLSADSVRDLGVLDHQCIAQVGLEAWPTVRSPDELLDALFQMIIAPEEEMVESERYFDSLFSIGSGAVVSIGGRRFWIALERWPVVRAAYPEATLNASSKLPTHLDEAVAPEVSIEIILQGRLEVRSPISETALAEDLCFEVEKIQPILAVLESKGIALSGKFNDPNAAEREWCDRRLLARIHKLTITGLRQRIKAVSGAVFYRYLLEHQHISIGNQKEGASGLSTVLEQLQGLSVPANLWEQEILPTRIKMLQYSQLNQLTLGGRFLWRRLKPIHRSPQSENLAKVKKTVQIGFVKRSDLGWLTSSQPELDESVSLSHESEKILEILAKGGALFWDELQRATRLLGYQLQDGLSELVQLGLVVSDGIEGLRFLLAKHKPGRRQERRFDEVVSDMGRWNIPQVIQGTEMTPDEITEAWAWQLLKRYGVVFRELWARENLAPQWRVLSRFYRRLEARGEVRGGRFIEGVTGEQFALLGVVERLRELRDEEDRSWYTIAAVDPLNLVGLLTADEKISATTGNRFVIRGGELIARQEGKEFTMLAETDPSFTEVVRRAIRLNGLVRARDPFVLGWSQNRDHPSIDHSGKVKNLNDYRMRRF